MDNLQRHLVELRYYMIPRNDGISDADHHGDDPESEFVELVR